MKEGCGRSQSLGTKGKRERDERSLENNNRIVAFPSSALMSRGDEVA